LINFSQLGNLVSRQSWQLLVCTKGLGFTNSIKSSDFGFSKKQIWDAVTRQNHRNPTSRSRIVVFFRREKCEKLSAFALPQKLVWSVVTGRHSVWSVTRYGFVKQCPIFCQILI
jgi:hypothetical protein